MVGVVVCVRYLEQPIPDDFKAHFLVKTDGPVVLFPDVEPDARLVGLLRKVQVEIKQLLCQPQPMEFLQEVQPLHFGDVLRSYEFIRAVKDNLGIARRPSLVVHPMEAISPVKKLGEQVRFGKLVGDVLRHVFVGGAVAVRFPEGLAGEDGEGADVGGGGTGDEI